MLQSAPPRLRHFIVHLENTMWCTSISKSTSMNSATGDETGRTQEDLEANAFAGLLLMPDQLLHEQILLYLVRQFYLWVMREPEAAAQWLKGETEHKKV